MQRTDLRFREMALISESSGVCPRAFNTLVLCGMSVHRVEFFQEFLFCQRMCPSRSRA